MKLPLLTIVLFFSLISAASAKDNIRLYTLDCGTIYVADLASLDREGRFDGQNITLKVPCYLIRHPKGDLLWDAGLEQSIADLPNGTGTTFLSTMERTLTEQLADLDLAPADIEYLSLSHWHPDHSGNANLFTGSTWVVNRAEHAFMFSDEMQSSSGTYAALRHAKTIMFDDTYDVFSDGSAVIVSTPGHTPGHSVLLLKLANSGAFLFSGDLHIFAEGHRLGTIPTFNSDAGETVRSMALFNRLAQENKARVIIEHDKTHFESLPPFPEYLE